MPSKILITGAAGQLGRLILDELLTARNLAPSSIIAVSREPRKLAECAARGIEIRRGDFDETATLAAAFSGADRILIVSTDALGEPGKRLRQHKSAVEAAKRAGAKRILYTSMPEPDRSVVTFAPDHAGTEQAIRATGIPYTILRNSWYMENLFLSLPQALKSGQWYSAAGQGKTAYVARADIAAAIAGALVSDASGNFTWTLTGDKAWGVEESAELASASAGQPLRVIHVSDEQLASGMAAAGVPSHFVPTLVSFDTNTRLGHLAAVTGDVGKLSGRKPMALDKFLAGAKQALLA